MPVKGKLLAAVVVLDFPSLEVKERKRFFLIILYLSNQVLQLIEKGLPLSKRIINLNKNQISYLYTVQAFFIPDALVSLLISV